MGQQDERAQRISSWVEMSESNCFLIPYLGMGLTKASMPWKLKKKQFECVRRVWNQCWRARLQGTKEISFSRSKSQSQFSRPEVSSSYTSCVSKQPSYAFIALLFAVVPHSAGFFVGLFLQVAASFNFPNWEQTCCENTVPLLLLPALAV